MARTEQAVPNNDVTRWHRVRSHLRDELGEEVYSSWFARVDLEDHSNGTVHLSVPTRFLKQWIQSHYRDQLIGLWRNECEDVRRIELTVRGATRPRPSVSRTAAGPDVRSAAVAAVRRDNDQAFKAVPTTARNDESGLGSPLDPRLTFDNFVEGSSNTLALAAARQIAAAKSGAPVAYNPFYLHAAVGLGKTHLLQAIAWEARKTAPERRILYLTAEHFMYRFVASLQDQSSIAFKNGLRGIDLLLIDDMQFLHGRQIQKEFCHTLNALIDGARQVVVAADRPPVELESLDERVRSRLGGGLLVEVEAPDYSLRRAILVKRIEAARKGGAPIGIGEDVIDYVARHVTANSRDLDGAVNRLIANNQLTGAPISLDLAEKSLRDLVRARETRRVRIEDIQRIVSKHFNVTRADLNSARRTRTIVRPRQIAMFLCKVMTPRSLPEIGRHFGNRDHTTVLHAVRKIENLTHTDTALADEIELLKRMLEN